MNDTELKLAAFDALARAVVASPNELQAVLITSDGVRTFISCVNTSPERGARMAQLAAQQLLQQGNTTH